MTHSWKRSRAAERIDGYLAAVKDVDIVDYVRKTDLESIPVNKAYRVHGSHLYVDILNMDELLGVTDSEGVQCHRRTLKFLNLHYRAVTRILRETDLLRVDFHNQRLHALVTKPYNTEDGAEASRIHRAVAVSQLIIDVLAQTGDEDEDVPAAKVRVGIDSGMTLAVNNGRSGSRESLFLGNAANQAAKMAACDDSESDDDQLGIYLTNNARTAIGLATVKTPAKTPLTAAEIRASQKSAALTVTVAQIVKQWRDDLEKDPVGTFEFYRHTPPFKNMDIDALTPANSRRQEAVSVYADIDGFTAYINKHIASNPKNVVKVFHVMRSELERVLSLEFEGRHIRFIGDCIHGLLCEGTAQTTDIEATISSSVLCSGGLRSSFNLAKEKLAAASIDVAGLGLAIGFEYGWMTVTRLGIQGDRVPCSVSRGVLTSEERQCDCKGHETAIGDAAYRKGTSAVRALFGGEKKTQNLDWNEAVDALADEGDASGRAARDVAYVASPVMARAAETRINPHAK